MFSLCYAIFSKYEPSRGAVGLFGVVDAIVEITLFLLWIGVIK